VTSASVAAQAREALAASRPAVYWTDREDAPRAREALHSSERADVAIVGGGFTGLWAALLARERDPEARVVLLEGGTVGSGASGRNGGFMAASLTHGVAHGAATWPEEMSQLQRLGHGNFDAIAHYVAKHDIPADLQRCGKTTVATAPHHVVDLEHAARVFRAHGEEVELWDAEAVRGDVHSPT
jgi:glycine/D-amino acid oxidase-like deaminating enzyme